MATANFQEIFKSLKTDAVTMAKVSFKAMAKEAEQDAHHLLDELKEKLSKWVTLLAEGKLDKEDFELLVSAQKDLVGMVALQKAGLAKIKIEHFRDSIINLITDSVFHAIPGLKGG